MIHNQETEPAAPQPVAVCAWSGPGCENPKGEGEALTHGICPTCDRAVRAEYALRTGHRLGGKQ